MAGADVTADDEATRNHFDKLVLIEAIVDRKSERRFALFSIASQPIRSSHRTAYVHVGLSSDKAALAVHQRW